METFIPPRPFVLHPEYLTDRKQAHQNLRQEIVKDAIDSPLLPLINASFFVPHCFTVQCCWGHFVHQLEPDPENLIPVSHDRDRTGEIGPIRYRIAYLALCLEDSRDGHEIYHGLEEMAKQDPSFIQFGSSDWFWERMPNTYCIQLEPERMKEKDSGVVSWEEALRIEELRGGFFAGIHKILLHSQWLPALQNCNKNEREEQTQRCREDRPYC